jgi:hypothetical protein
MILPIPSILACQPGGNTVVVSYWVTIAGPSNDRSGVSSSLAYRAVSCVVAPLMLKMTGRVIFGVKVARLATALCSNFCSKMGPGGRLWALTRTLTT